MREMIDFSSFLSNQPCKVSQIPVFIGTRDHFSGTHIPYMFVSLGLRVGSSPLG